MRRLALVLVLVISVVLLGAEGGVAAAPGRARATRVVHLTVIKGEGGQVLALVRVVVHGRAFPFVIDTGASRSLVDVALARQLHLKTIGKKFTVGAVGCTTVARNVRLRNWSVGGQRLPAIAAASTALPFAMGHGLGLLGSDVLSRFGSVTIDYAHSRMTLG